MADSSGSVVKGGLAGKPTIDAPSFQTMAVDTFSLRFNNHIGQITFLLETMDAQDREILLRHATAVMSLQSFKVLSLLLSVALQSVEKQIGPIPLPPGKEEEILGATKIERTK